MEEFRVISSTDAWQFLRNKHYAGRKPQITVAFGWYLNNRLVAVCTFGKPGSPNVCRCVCGNEYSDSVYELNRLCRVEDLKLQLSHFVSWCLRYLKQFNWIIISYSDTGMHHNGYIYQACNFMYTGVGAGGTHAIDTVGKHPIHIDKEAEKNLREVTTPKHRYIYFCTSNKKLKKEWANHLQFDIVPYPKGENQNYVLGEKHFPTVLDKNGNIVNTDNDNQFSKYNFI